MSRPLRGDQAGSAAHVQQGPRGGGHQPQHRRRGLGARDAATGGVVGGRLGVVVQDHEAGVYEYTVVATAQTLGGTTSARSTFAVGS